MKNSFNWKEITMLICILLVAAFFRFFNSNWDQNNHIHPDERFLTMVGNAMKLPVSIQTYLDPTQSQLNPVNIGYAFFVYGTFPIILNKLIAVLFSNDTYNAFTLQGRILSAFADLLIVIFIFKTARIFEKKYHLPQSTKFFASFLYAVAVLPIQLSHFFAVDTFLTSFSFATFYFMLRFSQKGSVLWYILAAFSFALAIASKITAISIVPLLFWLLLPYRTQLKSIKSIAKTLVVCGGFLLLTYFFLRLVYPYLFESSNFLDLRINTLFLNNLKSLKSFEGSDVWYPPAIQWITKPPIIFSLGNLAIFGVGIPWFLLFLFGSFVVVKKFVRSFLGIIFLWCIAFFLYQSMQFVKAMRYFILLYPFLAIIAGIGMGMLVQKRTKILLGACCLGLLIWPLMFLSIYIYPLSRITASQWIYKNIPDNNIILSELWDDPLPLSTTSTYGKQFRGEQMSVFDQDTPLKWEKMNEQLRRGNYYVLSSNRGWGSIPTAPWKYPQMAKFYQDLFAGRLAYQKVAEFSSYPSLSYLGIPLTLPDDWADESLTVYDHPKVLIYKNTQQ